MWFVFLIWRMVQESFTEQFKLIPNIIRKFVDRQNFPENLRSVTNFPFNSFHLMRIFYMTTIMNLKNVDKFGLRGRNYNEFDKVWKFNKKCYFETFFITISQHILQWQVQISKDETCWKIFFIKVHKGVKMCGREAMHDKWAWCSMG